MDGAFPSAKGEGFEAGAEYSEQRKGFRGNAENAKTKLCMRWAPGRRDCMQAAQMVRTRALSDWAASHAPGAQVEERALQIRRAVQFRARGRGIAQAASPEQRLSSRPVRRAGRLPGRLRGSSV